MNFESLIPVVTGLIVLIGVYISSRTAATTARNAIALELEKYKETGKLLNGAEAADKFSSAAGKMAESNAKLQQQIADMTVEMEKDKAEYDRKYDYVLQQLGAMSRNYSDVCRRMRKLEDRLISVMSNRNANALEVVRLGGREIPLPPLEPI